MSFKYEPLGKKTPKDTLMQALELPFRSVLIMGMVEGDGDSGGWVMQDCNLTVPDIITLSTLLEARKNLIATQLLGKSTIVKGPEDFKK